MKQLNEKGSVVVSVCMGKSCKKKEAKLILKETNKAFKNKCTLVKTDCQDFCDDAPVVLLGNSQYGKVKWNKMQKELEKLLNH